MVIMLILISIPMFLFGKAIRRMHIMVMAEADALPRLDLAAAKGDFTIGAVAMRMGMI